jgi:hypothetical protein
MLEYYCNSFQNQSKRAELYCEKLKKSIDKSFLLVFNDFYWSFYLKHQVPQLIHISTFALPIFVAQVSFENLASATFGKSVL